MSSRSASALAETLQPGIAFAALSQNAVALSDPLGESPRAHTAGQTVIDDAPQFIQPLLVLTDQLAEILVGGGVAALTDLPVDPALQIFGKRNSECHHHDVLGLVASHKVRRI